MNASILSIKARMISECDGCHQSTPGTRNRDRLVQTVQLRAVGSRAGLSEFSQWSPLSAATAYAMPVYGYIINSVILYTFVFVVGNLIHID